MASEAARRSGHGEAEGDRSHAALPSFAVCSEPIWGQSKLMQALRQQIARVAPAPSNVLLCGETGTGKGVLARAIHAASDRRRGPFVHADCAALPGGLIESELFGHERGAFSGASGRRQGRLELARGGTLFLDEIGELELRLQAKLLRALQDREFERLGGSRTLQLDARIVAASNRELPREVAAGRFRADLYYRLAVIEIEVPPLRARREDIPVLVAEGQRRLARRLGTPSPQLAACCVRALARHPWPGNVRELMNVLERLAVCRPGESLVESDLRGVLDPPCVAPSGPACGDPEELRIRQVLEACNGNVTRAARALCMPRSTLRYRLRTLQKSRDEAAPQLRLPGL
jgi:transcriptional regulator with GAF, ATPase, and Fis domain